MHLDVSLVLPKRGIPNPEGMFDVNSNKLEVERAESVYSTVLLFDVEIDWTYIHFDFFTYFLQMKSFHKITPYHTPSTPFTLTHVLIA